MLTWDLWVPINIHCFVVFLALCTFLLKRIWYFTQKSYQYFTDFFALMPIAIKIGYLLLLRDFVKESTLFHTRRNIQHSFFIFFFPSYVSLAYIVRLLQHEIIVQTFTIMSRFILSHDSSVMAGGTENFTQVLNIHTERMLETQWQKKIKCR